jgi:hypothetical protein
MGWTTTSQRAVIKLLNGLLASAVRPKFAKLVKLSLSGFRTWHQTQNKKPGE